MAPLKLIYFGLAPFTVNIRYILHWRATLFFFYRRRYSTIFNLCFFVRVLQMGEMTLKMYGSLHVMCLMFLSSFIVIRYFKIRIKSTIRNSVGLRIFSLGVQEE